MRATDEELAYLNRLLALLSGGYRARVDEDDEETVLVEYLAGENRVLSHLSLAWTYRVGPTESESAWIVVCAVTSGGDRMNPPGVDVYDACPAAPWWEACRSLLTMLVDDLADAVDAAEADREEAASWGEHAYETMAACAQRAADRGEPWSTDREEREENKP